MSKEIKWYIFNSNEEPLCWEDKVLEFDTKEKAEALIKAQDKLISKSVGEDNAETIILNFG